jgi:glutamate---cysteine ligase / carboxylate-amine ligase
MLGCTQEIEHCREIVQQGTSADAQIALYHGNELNGSESQAFAPVLAWLVGNTAKVT